MSNPKFAAEEFFDHLCKALKRQIEGLNHVGILLSGGLDSRALAGITRKVNPDIKISTWTGGHGHDHDSQYAKKIAKIIGANHTSVKIPETFLQDQCEEYAWALDGTVSAHGAHRLSIMKNVAPGCHHLMIGSFNDSIQ